MLRFNIPELQHFHSLYSVYCTPLIFRSVVAVCQRPGLSKLKSWDIIIEQRLSNRKRIRHILRKFDSCWTFYKLHVASQRKGFLKNFSSCRLNIFYGDSMASAAMQPVALTFLTRLGADQNSKILTSILIVSSL